MRTALIKTAYWIGFWSGRRNAKRVLRRRVL